MRLFELIDAEKASYPISLLCKVLRVWRSGYYDWKDRPPSKRERMPLSLIRLRRSTSVAERPTATLEYMPSLERWECAARANGLLD